MRRHCLAFLLLVPSLVWADPVPPSWDENRRSGFQEHQDQQKVFDRERAKGERAFIEEQEEWERQRQASIAEYKKEKKLASPAENGPEHREYLKEVEAEKKEREKTTHDYARLKEAMAKRTGKRVSLTEEEELGIPEKRPRYDVGKRVLYGAPSKFATGGTSGGSFGGSRPNNRFTPPAAFGGNNGAEVAPPMQEGDF
ncbi:MAG TPA: hypothetical protein PL182_02510, partial [Pseudobdellovibrionaceae bacterium]|nr:hypothetical protein [Pseudobdellovibrionaceae bacterium]